MVSFAGMTVGDARGFDHSLQNCRSTGNLVDNSAINSEECGRMGTKEPYFVADRGTGTDVLLCSTDPHQAVEPVIVRALSGIHGTPFTSCRSAH
jgi:hypothetical protein